MTRTFVSRTQRNYAPFRRESRVSGVSPRSFALRPTSSSTCCSEGYSPAANSRSHRLNRACIFRFCSGAAESYARAVCGSSGIVMVGFGIVLLFGHSTANTHHSLRIVYGLWPNGQARSGTRAKRETPIVLQLPSAGPAPSVLEAGLLPFPQFAQVTAIAAGCTRRSISVTAPDRRNTSRS